MGFAARQRGYGEMPSAAVRVGVKTPTANAVAVAWSRPRRQSGHPWETADSSGGNPGAQSWQSGSAQAHSLVIASPTRTRLYEWQVVPEMVLRSAGASPGGTIYGAG